MVASREDGALLIQLMRWGTEMGLDESLRVIFGPTFDPETASMEDPSVQKVLFFGETAGALVKHGLLDKDLLGDIFWIDGMWSKVGQHASRPESMRGCRACTRTSRRWCVRRRCRRRSLWCPTPMLVDGVRAAYGQPRPRSRSGSHHRFRQTSGTSIRHRQPPLLGGEGPRRRVRLRERTLSWSQRSAGKAERPGRDSVARACDDGPMTCALRPPGVVPDDGSANHMVRIPHRGLTHRSERRHLPRFARLDLLVTPLVAAGWEIYEKERDQSCGEDWVVCLLRRGDSGPMSSCQTEDGSTSGKSVTRVTSASSKNSCSWQHERNNRPRGEEEQGA